jgi:hypothetical protein
MRRLGEPAEDRSGGHPRFLHRPRQPRVQHHFDGRRSAQLEFVDGRLEGRSIRSQLNFNEDREIAIFFGCLGMFMYLFRGETANRTRHYQAVGHGSLRLVPVDLHVARGATRRHDLRAVIAIQIHDGQIFGVHPLRRRAR